MTRSMVPRDVLLMLTVCGKVMYTELIKWRHRHLQMTIEGTVQVKKFYTHLKKMEKKKERRNM